jgi:Ribonuclease G/E
LLVQEIKSPKAYSYAALTDFIAFNSNFPILIKTKSNVYPRMKSVVASSYKKRKKRIDFALPRN